MALSWEQIRPSKDHLPPVIIIYGGEGDGKTAFAAAWPNPYYCRTGERERPSEEDGERLLSFGVTETYEEFNDQVEFMLEGEHDRLTFVVDTLDCLEQIVIAEACNRRGWKSLMDGQFKEPKLATAEVWNEVIRKFMALKSAGFAVILIAHVKSKTEPGVTTDSYPRYRLNMIQDDDASSLAHMADLVGFVHQRVSIATEKMGFHKDNVKKRGESSGKRQIAVENRPGFIAKNKWGLTGSVPFEKGQGYEMFKPYFVEPYGRSTADNDNEPNEQEEAAA